MFGQRVTELVGQELKDTEDVPPRELTVEEAFAIALKMHQVERFPEAQAVYRQILEVEPEHARAMHFAGVLEHQLGHSDSAVELIQKSLELVADCADWYNNLGIVLQERKEFEQAIGAYNRAIELDPQHANAFSNLGVLLRATGNPAEAEEAYRT